MAINQNVPAGTSGNLTDLPPIPNKPTEPEQTKPQVSVTPQAQAVPKQAQQKPVARPRGKKPPNPKVKATSVKVPGSKNLHAGIPGASLTSTPGSMPWETPADISRPEEFIVQTANSLAKPEMMAQVAAFIENDLATLVELANTITFGAAQQGKISFDVAMLTYEGTLLNLINTAVQAGVSPEKIQKNLKKTQDSFDKKKIDKLAGVLQLAEMNKPKASPEKIKKKINKGDGLASPPVKE